MFVAGQRAKNKVQIGAYIDLATDGGIQAWLNKNPRKTKTDFLFEAIKEKLEAEKIPLPPEAGSRQLPSRRQVVFDTSAAILNDASSKSASAAGDILDDAAQQVADEIPSPKRKP